MQIRTTQSSSFRLKPSLSVGAFFLLLAQISTAHAAVYKCAANDGSTTYSDQPCGQNAQAIQVTPDPLHTTPKSTTPSRAPGNNELNQAHEQMVSMCARANYDAWYHTQNPKPSPEQTSAKLREALQTCRGIVPQTLATPAPQAPAPTRTPNTPLTPAMIAAAQEKSARETKASVCSMNAFNEWIKAQGHPLPDPNVRMAKMMEISNQCRRPLGLSDMIPPAPIVAPKPILQGPEGAAAAVNLAQLVKGGSIERLQKYLSTPGVDINDRPGTDEALLDYAAEQNQAPVARFLIEHGARVDAVQHQGPNAGFTALHRAATSDAAEVAQLLLAGGAEVNFHGPLGITPLILAASNGSRRTAEVLLDHGADVTTPDGHRETALSEATAHNQAEIIRLLLIHVPTPTSITLNAIAMRGDVDALRLIVRHDELVHDVPAKLKDDALRFIILGPEHFEERKQMIELLLADGADIDNNPPGIDVIPLMLAQSPAMAEFLLAHGANKKAKLSGPRLAQWLVCNNSGKDPKGTLQVVVDHGIDISGATSRDESAMPCAEYAKNADLIAFLTAHQVGSGRPKNNATGPSSRPAMDAALEEQLHPKRPCVRLDQITGSPTPMELYGALNDCLQKNRDSDAVALFALAGMDSAFDSLRVADKTAGQARQILIMDLFQRMPADSHTLFESTMKNEAADPPRHAALCEHVKRIGPPTYFPGYMVNHGLGVMQSALSNQAPLGPLVPNFDAAATWTNLLANYLNCADSKPGDTLPAPPNMAPLAASTDIPRRPDAPGMHCAITQLVTWIRAQNPPPTEDAKKQKILEIDRNCGTSLHSANVITSPAPSVTTPATTSVAPTSPGASAALKAPQSSALTSDGWPIPPEKRLASIKVLPANDQIILEVRDRGTFGTPNEIGVFNLTTHSETKWDILDNALREVPARQFGAHADWAPRGQLLYATQNSVHLVSRDGTTVELHLNMPGGLKPLDGMTAYALSPNAQQIAYLLYTRDRTETKEDKSGKLYKDLMIQKTQGSPPVSIWRDGFVIRPAWRPDGTAIAHTDSDNNLVLSDLAGKTLWSFHPGPPPKSGSIADYIQEIRWDPSGKRLAFLMGSPIPKIYLVNSDGTGTRPLEFRNLLGMDHDLSIRNFAWSPNGQQLAFRAEADSKCNYAALGFKFQTGNFPCIYSRNLFTVNIDGSHLNKVTPTPDFDSGELFWIQ